MTPAGWNRDPTGRFAQRWYDGDDWTDTVLGANGQPMHDPYPRTLGRGPSHPESPPPGPSGPQPSPSKTWQPVAPAPVEASTGPPLLVAVAAMTVGVALIAVCLFVLDWDEDAPFRDFRTGLGRARGLEWPDTIIKLYADWLCFALVGATVTFAGLATVARARGRRAAHVFAALLAGAGAVLHTFFVVRLFRGEDDPELPAWLGTAGYLVILAGIVVSARRRPA